ncbi:translational GTPase TypA [Clostridium formicaceticum]|uniref:Large ribosomal subunit assembly factor BipA n=1 Tax=Clostridium formicaceticum TaxID=1497 RepID=A0AAC9RI81_9CLOT|nr:translational GTPase TypA [Clostridium formicaceticum]AOY76159.1 GTP-binding protein TypA [Clostridium formicaceticum]ARE86531.1 GTP-binding protein TypA/BipA [Clostridium formicaceticum]
MQRQDIRNVAIIAHVDHGKTTLVDQMLKQSGTFRSNEVVEERVMDSNSLERERGITILSKNTAVSYNSVKINIIDTPGHADFGGEVERIMKMVDGVLLLVDAFEGPMPQTRFVLQKALKEGLTPIVVVNKIDRPEARAEEVIDEVLDLFIDLGANDDQLDFPVIYASARDGYAHVSLDEKGVNLAPLFEAILEYIPCPEGDAEEGLQLLISSIDYDKYIGRIGIGKIVRGKIAKGQTAVLAATDGNLVNVKISNLYDFQGLKRVELETATVGELVAVSGIADINIGDTICSVDEVEPLPFMKIDDPTISMNFMVSDSPFAGREGNFVTSRHLKDRLEREMLSNVAMRMEEISAESFKVLGRGELHLSILIETMRREGYEFAVSKPQVIIKKTEEGLMEPMEILYVETPEESASAVIEKIGQRKGEMLNMVPTGTGMMKLEFRVPARGLIGYRSEFLTDTKGYGTFHHLFDGYDHHRGDIRVRTRGSLIAFESGTAVSYGIYHAQERGKIFIHPGTEVYEGMIVGESSRLEDIAVNVCKRKQLTNIRSSGADDALKLVPPVIFSLEQALEFIADDELVEVTPKSIRLRKRILDKLIRERTQRRNQNQ